MLKNELAYIDIDDSLFLRTHVILLGIWLMASRVRADGDGEKIARVLRQLTAFY